jgi:hypothetical protein
MRPPPEQRSADPSFLRVLLLSPNMYRDDETATIELVYISNVYLYTKSNDGLIAVPMHRACAVVNDETAMPDMLSLSGRPHSKRPAKADNGPDCTPRLLLSSGSPSDGRMAPPMT